MVRTVRIAMKLFMLLGCLETIGLNALAQTTNYSISAGSGTLTYSEIVSSAGTCYVSAPPYGPTQVVTQYMFKNFAYNGQALSGNTVYISVPYVSSYCPKTGWTGPDPLLLSDSNLLIVFTPSLNGPGSAYMGAFTVSASPNPAVWGNSVQLYASEPYPNTTGTVTFTDGPTTLGSASMSNSLATYSISSLSVGSHSITAAYSGNVPSATSSPLTLTINRVTPTISWATPAAIAYGTALSATQLNATASVAGTFAYSPTSGTVPTAGTHTLSVTFTPTDTTHYNTVTSTVTLTVSKATPTISAWPNASAITYGQTLASSTLSGGTALVAGTFAWTTSSTAPTAGTASHGVTFTPSDTTDYNAVSGSVNVTVNKATPTASGWPTGSSITYGQTLASSTLSGGTASVAGNFAWTTSSMVPTAGTASHGVTFTPSDTTDYNAVSGSVNVTVNKATPTVSAWPTASSISYGQTLASSTLLGGSATPTGTFAWTTPSMVPTAGTPSESVTFTPSDTTDYNSVTATVTLTVNQVQNSNYSIPVGSGTLTYTETVSSAGTCPIGSPTGPTQQVTQYLFNNFAYNGQALSGSTVYISVPAQSSYCPTSGWNGPNPLILSDSDLLIFFTPSLNGAGSAYVGAFTISANPNPAVWGSSVQLQASEPYPNATGTVTFSDGSTTLGSASMSNQVATYSISSLSVGSHSITAAYSGNAPSATSSPLTLTITPATPTISWATPADITYGTALSSTQLNASASYNGTVVPGTFEYTPAAGEVLDSGSQTLLVAFFPNDSTTYSTAGGSVQLQVIPSASDLPQTFYYYCIPDPSNNYCSSFGYNSAGPGYDGAGNLKYSIDLVTGGWSFSYDTLNRLTTAQNTVTTSTSAQYANNWGCWAYDAFGNRLSQSMSTTACGSNPPLTSWAQYNGTVNGTNNNQMSATNRNGNQANGYDPSGDVTNDGINQYLYDGEGRICAVMSEPIPNNPTMMQYIYDAEGARVAKGMIATWSCDTATNGFTPTASYVLGLSNEQLTETDGQGQWKHTNVYAAGTIIATYDAPSGTPALHFQLEDWLGSRRVQTNITGTVEEWYVSLPYGDGLTPIPNLGCLPSNNCYSEDPTEHHFTGKERDAESGNDYFGARYYASSMGRFMSPDKPFADQHPANPQSWNLYSYTRNNPLRFVDDDGEKVNEAPTVIVTYHVSGGTAAEAWNNAPAASGISGGYRGNTDTNIGVGNYSFDTSSKSIGTTTTVTDTLTSADVNLSVTITLPAWDGYSSATPAEQQQWDSLAGGLKDHEDGHKTIAEQGANALDKSLPGTSATGTGNGLPGAQKSAADALGQKVEDKHQGAVQNTQQNQDAYDKRTDHGAKPDPNKPN